MAKGAAAVVSPKMLVRADVTAPQVEPEHYGHAYNCKPRLASYWHQVDEVLRMNAGTALEVGTGSGYVRAALKREGVDVRSLDIDRRLAPDVVGSLCALPVADRAVDVAVCCQVLEHLPFTSFMRCLRELSRVSSRGIVVSLPDQERYVRWSTDVAGRELARGFRDWPRKRRARPPVLCPEHLWEIGCGDVGLEDVLSGFRMAVGQPPRTYRVYEFPYHRFFVIEKAHPS
jgi:hypothetical protein